MDAVRAGRLERATPARLRVGRVLAVALGFWGRRLPFVVLVAAGIFGPLLWLEVALMERAMQGGGAPSEVVWVFLLVCLNYVAPLVLQALLTVGVLQHLAGEAFRPALSVWAGVRSLPSLSVFALLVGALLAGLLLLGGFVATSPTILDPWGPAGLLLGAAVVAIGVSWLFCLDSMGPHALVAERLGGWQALRRGRRLTRGSRWRLLAILLVMVALYYAIGLVFRTALGEVQSPGQWRIQALASTCLHGLLVALTATCTAVSYAELRRGQDGPSEDELVGVFE